MGKSQKIKGGTLTMSKILRKDVLTVGGIQSQFIGVQVGEEFILRPDSGSGLKPNNLMVKRHKTELLIQGGTAPLRIWLQPDRISYVDFESLLTNEDKNVLQELASDLTGYVWFWPDVGEVLRQRIEDLGEEKVHQVLQKLFLGVDSTLERVKFWSAIPFLGKKLTDIFCPQNRFEVI